MRIILPVQTPKKAVNTHRPACTSYVALKHLPSWLHCGIASHLYMAANDNQHSKCREESTPLR